MTKSDILYRSASEKLYEKIKEKVKFNKKDCLFHCSFAHRAFCFCNLFDEIIPECKRCRSCKEIFGNEI